MKSDHHGTSEKSVFKSYQLVLTIVVIECLALILHSMAEAQTLSTGQTRDQICYTPTFACNAAISRFGAPCVCPSPNAGAGRGGPSDNRAAKEILTAVAALDLSKFTFEYFQKPIDGTAIYDALTNIGIKLTIKEPKRDTPASNSVLISADVPVELARFIALTLVYNKISVKAVIYYGINDSKIAQWTLAQSKVPLRVRLIQIGTVVDNDSVRDFTEKELMSDPLPLGGLR